MLNEWETKTLGEVITLQRGFDLPIQERQLGNIPIVSSSGVTGTHSVAKVDGPGVITGRYGTIGQVFYVKENFWPLNTTLYVKDFKGNDKLFISYFLRTLDFEAHNDKSSVPGVNRNHLHLIKVNIPPLAEQQAIASMLGALDDKIELNRRLNQTLEEMARALFQSWFVDFDPVRAKMDGSSLSGMDPITAALFPTSFENSPLGEIPQGWQIGSFKNTINIIGGGTPKTSEPIYWGGNIPWFSVVDAPNPSDVFVINTEKKITKEGLENSSTRILPIGTTIISARGTVGRLAFVPGLMTMNQSCYGIKGKDNRGDFYTYYSLKNLVSQLQQSAHGSVFDTITGDTFQKVNSVNPPIIFTLKFDEIVTNWMKLIHLNLQNSETLTTIRDEFLPRLMSGQLRVKDALDELDKIGVK